MHSDRVEEEPESAMGPSPATRWIGGLLAVATGSVVGIALLGIEVSQPYCGIKSRTGYPCPTCGMTTSFRALARGHLAKAFEAHPFGPALFAVFVLACLAGTAQAITGKAILRKLGMRWWWWVMAALGVLLGWTVKLVVGIQDGTYPLG